MINHEIFCKSGPWFCGRHHICTDIMPLAGVHTFMRLTAGSSDKFPTYSPSGDTLFDFVVVYNGSKLRTRGKVCYYRLPVAMYDSAELSSRRQHCS